MTKLRTIPTTMETARLAPVAKSGPSSAAAVATVERRLAEYLRCWGLTDDLVVAAHARRWTRHVLQDAAGHGASPRRLTATELEHRAMSRAVNAVYLWIRRLTRHLERDGVEASTGLVALRVRRLLSEQPHAFLKIHHLPESFVAAVRESVRPVVPHAVHQSMPPHPLGEPIAWLTPAPYRAWLQQAAARAFGRRREAWESSA